MSDLWFPGTDRSRPATFDGGSILGGQPKCLWHDTETSGVPSYSTGYFPNMTLDPKTGHTWQHIPADRACRALRNESGGVQTNRWNVFQIEVIGWVNKIPFHPVMAEIAQWLHDVRGTPLECTVDWLVYPASYGNSRVRMSGTRWSGYSGHLGHQHAPENSHGDPGSPFPIDQILAGAPQEDPDMAFDAAQAKLLKDTADTVEQIRSVLFDGHVRESNPIDNLYKHAHEVHDGMVVPGTTSVAQAFEMLFARVRNIEATVEAIASAIPDVGEPPPAQ